MEQGVRHDAGRTIRFRAWFGRSQTSSIYPCIALTLRHHGGEGLATASITGFQIILIY